MLAARRVCDSGVLVSIAPALRKRPSSNRQVCAGWPSSASVVPPLGKAQYDAYVWYFPYVNERLHALQQRHPDLLLADWAAISNRPGITYDAIHLNTAGAQLLINLIRSTIGG